MAIWSNAQRGGQATAQLLPPAGVVPDQNNRQMAGAVRSPHPPRAHHASLLADAIVNPPGTVPPNDLS